MIYSILKPIIRLSLLIYFRRIDVIGQKNVPKSGPVIFVANHPNALMDPLTVATTLNRKVHFLAGAEWFGKGLKARFFKNQFNMIPVHRPWLSKSKEVSNEDMFEECYKSLKKGKCIILFPEASSESVSKIRDLKTGAVRIKDGFEKYMNNGQEVPIIPVGLSYSNSREFQSRVVVKIGEAVEFKNEENVTGQSEIYRLQTSQMQQALKDSIIHIDNVDNEGLVKKISRLYIDSHAVSRGVSFKNGQNKFEFNQDVAKVVEHFESEKFDNYNEMSDRIDRYFGRLEYTNISDDYIGKTKRSKISAFTWIYLILGSLIALPSLVLFVLPYQLTRLIFLKKFKDSLNTRKEAGTLDETFTGTLIFGLGTIIFILWTLFVSAGIGFFIGLGPAIISLVCMYPMMRFSMTYARIALRFKRHFRTKMKKGLTEIRIRELEEERMSIVAELKKYHVEYDSIAV